jgi:chlorophyll(ide) b reductase
VLGRLGRVNRWINNAGTAGERQAPLWALDRVSMLETTTTNLFGALTMSSLAVQIMREQPPSKTPVYYIFNMGFSDLGARLSRSPIPHKPSKIGVAVVTRSRRAELATHGMTSIGVHALSSGLVKTDLLRRVTTPDAAGFVEIAAERPEAVARSLVPKIRQVRGRGSNIRHRSLPVMIARILFRLSLRVARGLANARRLKPRE